jgi:hypothetical protein
MTSITFLFLFNLLFHPYLGVEGWRNIQKRGNIIIDIPPFLRQRNQTSIVVGVRVPRIIIVVILGRGKYSPVVKETNHDCF